MSGMFPHHVIEQKKGFVFIVTPIEDDPDSLEAAEEVRAVLEESWPTAPSELTVDDVRDPEEAELILADILEVLGEAESEYANKVLINSVIVVGALAIVNVLLLDEEVNSEEEEEDDDADQSADEEEFE
ncbi:hypothetical protein pEaSNUABM14_00008 [Erwinia phage pEa_SNUABM_14]|uniref:Uncharacterized protein n=1 Tax=Erwinia phage pEa_SNUABM_7 TaxID=2866695 RepID=A0AAE8BLS9_9CAUD|nr:hypothetical protein MPK74_gp008 [Erwinia phage pEa_SNUABM_7]QYW02967.1 hypothetical protein pEaSNUABM13_00008 [Erwinia phage pEa_SNUABM_13]QYW03310.1 hypothetical protein pEaSNUABM34_00008 [Erwinia phage pEa_SNUABM_34]QYW03651.1 hypothetical protein pEaSNUABM45_00008 [Erwinia phage pEa_SNUABM_45]QYW03992.1 hypothetical protein pEaSNUABM46_00008 [Erwinia phage pEa_SNUABM_46]QYW04333.1 hypothetical protein pEaSNUABM14_00008 [Erwinia phage pEa_SNUABM_14]QYW05022.1 hypothetical protein pEaSNU